MKTRFRFLTYGLFALAVTLTSCEKEGLQGPAGPSGAIGQQGVQGEAGPAGEDGEALGVPGPQGETGSPGADGNDGTNGTDGNDGNDGADGNANVMASEWITTEFIQTPQRVVGFSITDPNLTKEVINNSLILGYGKRNNVFQSIYPLPNEILNQRYYIELSDLGGENYVLLFRGRSIDNDLEVFNLLKEVKYFVIPANSLTGKSSSDFENMSYDELVSHFGLEQ